MIAESSWSGHRLVYVKILTQGALERGLDVAWALSADVKNSHEYSLHLAPLERHVAVHVVGGDCSLRALKRLARRHGVQRLIVPDSNKRAIEIAFALPFTKHPETLCLMMRDPRWELMDDGYSIRTLLKIALFAVASTRRTTRIVWLREPGHASRKPHANDPVILESDVARIRRDASIYKSKHRLSPGVYWFGVVGVISEAKQIPLIALAVARVSQLVDKPVGLALLGPWALSSETAEKISQICSHSAIVTSHNPELHSNYEINVAIASLDCVVAAYSGVYGPSSTLGKTAALGVPSVAAGPRSQQLFAQSITGEPGVSLTREALAKEMLRRVQNEPPRPRADLDSGQFVSALLD